MLYFQSFSVGNYFEKIIHRKNKFPKNSSSSEENNFLFFKNSSLFSKQFPNKL